MKNWKIHLKTYKWSLVMLAIVLMLLRLAPAIGTKAVQTAGMNLREMLLLVPPIFIIMGLLDVWVPKEAMMKVLGHESGWLGLFVAFILGTAAAGPLYVAFPIGLLLLKKGARLANVIFFLGVWGSTKLPVLLYELASFGATFTLTHIAISLPLYLLGAYAIERSLTDSELSRLHAAIDSDAA